MLRDFLTSKITRFAVSAALMLMMSGVFDTSVALARLCSADFEGYYLSRSDYATTFAITRTPMTFDAAKRAAEVAGGRLAHIYDSEINDEIVERLGNYFTVGPTVGNSSGKRAWIGLHDPTDLAPENTVAPERFQWLRSDSGFANWAPGQPDNYCSTAEKNQHPYKQCFNENWATIGADGKWDDLGDHGTNPLLLKGVAVWDEVLDCVAWDMKTEKPEDFEFSDVDFMKDDVLCTDSNAMTLQPCDETVGGGWFCETESYDCILTFVDPICYGAKLPKTHPKDRDYCWLDPVVKCPNGIHSDYGSWAYSWDRSIDQCQLYPPCLEGGAYNNITDRCEKVVYNECNKGGYSGVEGGAGYAWDESNKICQKQVYCNNGGAYVSARDRCELEPAGSSNNDSTYKYVAARTRYEREPECNTGLTYNTTYDVCTRPIVKTCTPPYAYNIARDRCEKQPPDCPSGTSYNSSSKACEVTPTCPAGYARTGMNCKQTQAATASCTYANRVVWKYESNWDYDTYSLTSIGGNRIKFTFAYNGSTVSVIDIDAWGKQGQKAKNVPSWGSNWYAGTVVGSQEADGWWYFAAKYVRDAQGVYTSYYDESMGYVASFDGSFVGYPGSWYTYISGWSVGAPSAGITVYRQSSDYWEGRGASGYYTAQRGAAVRVHPTQFAVQGCTYSCPSGGTLSGDTCVKEATAGCPSGTSYHSASDKCRANPTCPGGSLDAANNVCYVPFQPTCQYGTYNSVSKLCTDPAICRSSGLLDTGLDKCYLSAQTGCPSSPAPGYLWDASVKKCQTPLICADGAYNSVRKRCEKQVVRECGAYTWNEAAYKCLRNVECPNQSGFSTAALAKDIDRCLVEPIHQCASGTTYTGLPVTYCESIPICEEGQYSPTTKNCSIPSCTDGDNCMQLIGETRIAEDGFTQRLCSPNKCQDSTEGWYGWDDDEGIGDTDLKGDGERDDYGNCLDQLYIFNGTDKRCTKSDNRGAIRAVSTIVAAITIAAVAGPAIGTWAGSLVGVAPGAVATGAAQIVGQAVIQGAVVGAMTGTANLVIDKTLGLPNGGLMSIATSAAMGAVTNYMKVVAGNYVLPGTQVFEQGGTVWSATSEVTVGASVDQVMSIAGSEALVDAAMFVNPVNGATVEQFISTTVTESALGTVSTTMSTFVEYLPSGLVNIVEHTATGITNSNTLISNAIAAAQWARDNVPPEAAGSAGGMFGSHKCCYPNKTGCTADELSLFALVKSGYCRQIGEYCSSKFISICLARKRTYCCFQSKLARIIQENGRPTLQVFGPKGDWGSARKPNCRGFTPEEFALLDFSAIDISEYTDDLIQEVEGNLSGIVDQVMGLATNRATSQINSAKGVKTAW
ncbi:MAG: conjugal transfer protein TraN [Trichlorobacter sp.]|nr:conjugal transfer protein TraN [Trichlorobacter sp.]